MNEEHFENCACRKGFHDDNNAISLNVSVPQTHIRLVIDAFWNFSGVEWTEKIWQVFRVKPPLLNSSGVV